MSVMGDSVRHHATGGFALMIVAALFLAFALIATAVIERSSITTKQDQFVLAEAQLHRLSEAIIRYRKDNADRYPCPALLTIPLADANFGAAQRPCNLGGPLLPLSPSVVQGAVPVRELVRYGIQLEDMFDPWGNRIVYSVDRALTNATTPSPDSDRIIVKEYLTGLDEAQDVLTTQDYVLVSYGPDGIGATPRERTSVAIPCAQGAQFESQLRFTNCQDDNAEFAKTHYRDATVSNTNIPTSNVDYFDDVIVHFTAQGIAGASGSVNGACGTATITPQATPPFANLCGAGTSTTPSAISSTTWQWTCQGSGGGSNATCTAPTLCECYGNPLICDMPPLPNQGRDPVTGNHVSC